ncbi:MAG TPA: T9SS type A sorting domain-containing protein [Salinivirgaceae bacterium]|nr:T9SS type A sorting domain-containing protein [Salinivirgaceae bacterium]
MKPTLFLTIAIVFANYAIFAQTPYTENDFIQCGSYSIYQQTSFFSDPQPIDNFTNDGWNYNYPETYTVDTTYALSIEELGLESTFPNADLCLKEPDYYIVLQHNDSKLWLLGLVAAISGNTMPVAFQQPMDIMHFPLSVGTNISRQQSIPLTFTPEQLGLTADDLGIPEEPDSIRITISIKVESSIADYNMFGEFNEAYLENSKYTIGYSVKVLYVIFGQEVWIDINSLADSRTFVLKSYWMPGYGLPVCKIGINNENQVIDFKIQPDVIVGIESAANKQVKCYPIPFSNILYVESNMPQNIQLYDYTGRVVTNYISKCGITEISTEHLQTGFYFIKVDGEVVKILKQ